MHTLRIFLLMTVSTIAVGGGLIGCGTKGPLYIPEQRYPQDIEQQPEQPASTIPPVQTLPTVKDY
jgi:predicted small lipoprotein YifL